MTTPARNENVQRTLDYPYRQTSRLGKVTDGVVPVRGMVLREQRPASSTSPRRADGTRAPKAWSNFGWIGQSGVVPLYFIDRSGNRHDYSMGHQSIASTAIREAPSHDIRCVEAATNKLLQNLKNQKVDLGTALSQARSTIKMVTAVGKDIHRQVDRFERRYPKEWRRVLKGGFNNSSGRYLEVVYGWKPLIDDISGSCEQLAETMNRGASVQLTARGHSTIDRTTFRGTSGVGGVENRYESQETTSCHIAVVMWVPSWALQDLSSLGLTNPFAVGWENLPYSHVVDWVVPIGNWLNTFDSGTFLRFKEGSRSMISRSKYQHHYRKVRNVNVVENGYYVIRPPRGLGWRFDRVVLRDLPQAYFPRLRNPLTLNHMAEALTMLVQKFRVPASRVNIRF